MQLVPALRIGKAAIRNQYVRAQLEEVEKTVTAGSSLSQALAQHTTLFSGPDIEAVVAVGEESGNLSEMLSSIACNKQEELERLLSTYSTLFQPIFMAILGLLVALLIIAVYVPIMSLPSVIS